MKFRAIEAADGITIGNVYQGSITVEANKIYMIVYNDYKKAAAYDAQIFVPAD
jgi:hypothetical protein